MLVKGASGAKSALKANTRKMFIGCWHDKDFWFSYHVNLTNPASVYVNLTLQWRQNEHDGVSNHQPHDCLLNLSFRHRSKKTSKIHVTGLCQGNSPVTGEFSAQRASNAENVSIWWRQHEKLTWKCQGLGNLSSRWLSYFPYHNYT